MIDIRQNKKYANYLKSQGWIVEEKNGVLYFIKRMLFLSIIKVQRPKKINYKDIEFLRKKYRAFQVVIEPNTAKETKDLVKHGYKNISPFIPSKTVILQLTKSEDSLLESFTKDTRYCIRKSERVNILEVKDLRKFRHYWRKSVDIKRHVLSVKQMNDLKNAFGDDCLFLVAEDGISGAIFLVAGNVGYYWYGFVGSEGREKLSQYKVLWEGIKWAKSRGATCFDMEGIFDERFPIPAWRGFTKFKKGFEGKVAQYPGALMKLTMPL
jgi:lipid II:glycine glycyltransferase (peptidoglycan interpeptide bridge formation enzyme)